MGTDVGDFPILLVTLACLAAALAIPVLIGAVRVRPLSGKRMLVAGLTAAAAAIFLALAFPTALTPETWVVMQDGTTAQNLLHVNGAGVHESPFSRQVALLVSPDNDVIRLPSVIRLNRVLTCVNAVLFLLVAAGATGSVLLSLPLAWIFLNNRNAVLASASEYPAPIITLLFLLAAIAGYVIRHRDKAGRTALAASLGLLAVIAPLAAGFRPEAGLVAGLALAAALASVFVPARIFDGLRLQSARWAQAIGANPREALEPVFIVATLIAAAVAMEMLLEPPASWIAGALNPINNGFSSIPAYLMLFLPAPVLILAAIGMFASLRRPLVWLFLPLSALLLLKLHVAAGGTEFNHWFRLISTDVPLVLLLAAIGMGTALAKLEGLAVHRAWRTAAAVALACSVLLPVATSGNPGGYQLRPDLPDGGTRQRNNQVEVTYLIKSLRAHPDCVFETSVYDHGRYVTMFFGKHLEATSKPPRVQQGCRLTYVGLDCNFEGGQECIELTRDAVEIDSLTVKNAPYGQTAPYLDKPHRNTITLGIYRKDNQGDGAF